MGLGEHGTHITVPSTQPVLRQCQPPCHPLIIDPLLWNSNVPTTILPNGITVCENMYMCDVDTEMSLLRGGKQFHEESTYCFDGKITEKKYRDL